MRRIRVVVVAAIVMAALSACGSSGEAEKGDGGQVATLATPEVGAEAGTTAGKKPKADPPRERLDTTPEEFDALLVPYNKCLKRAGITSERAMKEASDSRMTDTKRAGKKQQKQNAAARVCEVQYYPLPPWEKDPANPEARDFAVDVVKCLKQKGVEYVEVSEDGLSYALGGDQNDSRSISMGMDLAPECEREVAAK